MTNCLGGVFAEKAVGVQPAQVILDDMLANEHIAEQNLAVLFALHSATDPNEKSQFHIGVLRSLSAHWSRGPWLIRANFET